MAKCLVKKHYDVHESCNSVNARKSIYIFPSFAYREKSRHDYLFVKIFLYSHRVHEYMPLIHYSKHICNVYVIYKINLFSRIILIFPGNIICHSDIR